MTTAPIAHWPRLASSLVKTPLLQLAVIVLAATWLYLPTFNRYFVSEDFTLLWLFETKPFLGVLAHATPRRSAPRCA
jgi:hypothetical protein